MKKIKILTLILCLLFLNMFPQNVSANKITVNFNGNNLTFDQYPVIESGRVLVPFRRIFESLGARVNWDDNTRVATGTKNDITVMLKVDSKVAILNGRSIDLDVPTMIIGGRVMVPVRFVSENMGAKVQWDDSSRIVYIRNDGNPIVIQTQSQEQDKAQNQTQIQEISLTDYSSAIQLCDNNSTVEAIANFDGQIPPDVVLQLVINNTDKYKLAWNSSMKKYYLKCSPDYFIKGKQYTFSIQVTSISTIIKNSTSTRYLTIGADVNSTNSSTCTGGTYAYYQLDPQWIGNGKMSNSEANIACAITTIAMIKSNKNHVAKTPLDIFKANGCSPYANWSNLGCIRISATRNKLEQIKYLLSTHPEGIIAKLNGTYSKDKNDHYVVCYRYMEKDIINVFDPADKRSSGNINNAPISIYDSWVYNSPLKFNKNYDNFWTAMDAFIYLSPGEGQ
ncbi:MAG TPA: copper amine oxidase N-terminal domain-containing protein [Clostridia bacterium]